MLAARGISGEEDDCQSRYFAATFASGYDKMAQERLILLSTIYTTPRPRPAYRGVSSAATGLP